MTTHQNNSSAQYTQYMFKVLAQAAILLMLNKFSLGVKLTVAGFTTYTVSLAFFSSMTTHTIHKCHFNYEYGTVEYRKPSSSTFIV